MAEQLIESLSADFDPTKYHDEYRERVLELIERKAAGEEIAVEPEAEEPAAGARSDGGARGEPGGGRAATARRSRRPRSAGKPRRAKGADAAGEAGASARPRRRAERQAQGRAKR